jgi:hypothetical protein
LAQEESFGCRLCIVFDRNAEARSMKRFLLLSLWVIGCFATADIVADLELLRKRCLYFSLGRSPANSRDSTQVHGLYSQSIYSATKLEIDLASTGFSLAGLPSAVKVLGPEGVTTYAQAEAIARDAAGRLREMVEKSASATSSNKIAKYGYGGILFHFSKWNDSDGEFHGKQGTEVSIIDTAIALWGLLVCAEYFGGSVKADFETALATIRWTDWLVLLGPDSGKFYLDYWPGTGFSKTHWGYTQETMLICLLAAMSDNRINAAVIWRAWDRQQMTYGGETFHATYYGDPFTVFYGQAFVDFERLGADLDGVDWFREARQAYLAAVKYFATERGYLFNAVFTSTTIVGDGLAIAKPNTSGAPIYNAKNKATTHGIAGGLSYYGQNATSNLSAQALSKIVRTSMGFYRPTLWPASSFDAQSAAFPVVPGTEDEWDIGQDISYVGIALDNYLDPTIHDMVMGNEDLIRVLSIIFPTSLSPISQPMLRPSAEPSTEAGSAPFGEPTRSFEPSSGPRSGSAEPNPVPTEMHNPAGNPALDLPTLLDRVENILAALRRATISTRPSVKPSAQPSWKPSAETSFLPSGKPTSKVGTNSEPSSRPTKSSQSSDKPAPSAKPSWRSDSSTKPNSQPSDKPTVSLSDEPSSVPTISAEPSEPTSNPSAQPNWKQSTESSAELMSSSVPSGEPTQLFDSTASSITMIGGPEPNSGGAQPMRLGSGLWCCSLLVLGFVFF